MMDTFNGARLCNMLWTFSESVTVAFIWCAQEVRGLLEKEAVSCIFIQDNPTFDSLRSSLGLPRCQPAHQPADCNLALQVAPQLRLNFL